ncbi:MAG: protein kinase, partial [Chloroflexaceae bacterium]|nr:protein kinase [Chloroflexaceae bacterium]
MDNNPCPFCHNPVSATSVYCPSCGELSLLQGKYRITGLLGQGGFGVVYEAQDTYLTRRYAIKVINAKTRTAQEAIKAEANIHAQYARSLAFMPEIYDICELGMRIALVMEFIEGQSLDALLDQQGAWSVPEVEAFLDTMLGYLGQLHAVGIVHRDIKPANIKVRPDNSYALLDFGISKQQTQGATLTGAKALSIFYSPPEQMKGLPTDARSDFYSLAATAYHLLAGLPPPGADVRETSESSLPLPRQLARGESPALAKTLQAMMEMDPLNRPPDARTAQALLKGELATVPSWSSAGLATIAIAPSPTRPSSPAAPMSPPAPAPAPLTPPPPLPQTGEQPVTAPPAPPSFSPTTSPSPPASPQTEPPPSIPLSDQETIPVPSLQQRREQARAAPPPPLPSPPSPRAEPPSAEPPRRDEPPAPEPPRRRQHIVRPAP